MMKMSKYRLRNLISSLISFFLSLLLTILFLSISFRVGICSQEIFLHSVSNSDYYEVLYDKLSSHMYALLDRAKLPERVGEGVISESQVYIDGKVYINSVLKGKHPSIETTEIEDKLRSNIENYLTEQSIPLEPMKDGIDEIIDTVVIDYKNSLQFKLADYFYDYSASYATWENRILIFNLIVDPILILFLLFLHRKKHHALRYVSYAAISATIANTLFVMYRMRVVESHSILQGDTFYQQMVHSYIKDGIAQGYYISIAGGILFLISLSITQILKRHKS
ncbi:MAG: hypothetical protein ACERKN_09930 [Velocimicrobium sp.]